MELHLINRKICSRRIPQNSTPLQLQANHRRRSCQGSQRIQIPRVIIDRNINFIKHLTELNSKCENRTNVLRSRASTTWGGDRRTILQLYKAIVRPFIEYFSFVYHGSLTNSHNKKTESIQNACIRTATGALADTDIKDLLASADMPTCEDGRIEHCRVCR